MDVTTCPFCSDDRRLTSMLPLLDAAGAEAFVDCDRSIYTDEHCIVTLAPTQLSRGHAIAVLRTHCADVTDPRLSVDDHAALLSAIQRTSRAMKARLECERVYIASLCDVVEHLHYHLIPRYATDIKGFAFVGQREWAHRSGYWIGPKDREDRVRYLEELARLIRSGLG